MVKVREYIKLTRPINGLMTAISAVLGLWLVSGGVAAVDVFCLVLASFTAVSFGNVINDLHDITTDRISHPRRPLASGTIRPASALLFAIVLAALSMTAGFTLSTAHGIGSLVPLIVLTIYARYLKATPLIGNIIVSLMVGYAILFGALNSPLVYQLYAPAGCACVLNLAREIVKDLQDKEGDTAAGLRTSAAIPLPFLRIGIVVTTVVYGVLFLVPWMTGHFHLMYLMICLCVAAPLHGFWLYLYLGRSWESKISGISRLIKLEMLAGLAALALDRLVY
jgi:geranylgeranylglycerol-phosphate geranylgeranyltransferase